MAASSCCQCACTSPCWNQPNPNKATVANHTCTSKFQYETVSRRKKLPKHFQEFRRNRLKSIQPRILFSTSKKLWFRSHMGMGFFGFQETNHRTRWAYGRYIVNLRRQPAGVTCAQWWAAASSLGLVIWTAKKHATVRRWIDGKKSEELWFSEQKSICTL